MAIHHPLHPTVGASFRLPPRLSGTWLCSGMGLTGFLLGTNDSRPRWHTIFRCYSFCVMDDAGNVLVLTVFAASMVAVIVGYLLAWRSNRNVSRRVGSLMVAAVAGFAALFMSVWLIGAVMPFPPPDGGSVWGVLGLLLIFSPLPLGAFYLCAKFIRRAFRNEPTSN
jgi:hypothetical protein